MLDNSESVLLIHFDGQFYIRVFLVVFEFDVCMYGAVYTACFGRCDDSKHVRLVVY